MITVDLTPADLRMALALLLADLYNLKNQMDRVGCKCGPDIADDHWELLHAAVARCRRFEAACKQVEAP